MTGEVLRKHGIIAIGITARKQVASVQVGRHDFKTSPSWGCWSATTTAASASAETTAAASSTGFPCRHGIALKRLGSVRRNGGVEMEQTSLRAGIHVNFQSVVI